MKNILIVLLFLCVVQVKADFLTFRVASVFPISPVARQVIVDVMDVPSMYIWGWKYFNLNIDGYNYPITQYNAIPTGPWTLRAWFVVPSFWWGPHRMQLHVGYWTQAVFGYPVPVARWMSYPMIYNF